MNNKFSGDLFCFGKQADRFSTYREDVTLEKKFKLASKVKGLRGLEIILPPDDKDIEKIGDLVKAYNFEVSTVLPDTFLDSKWMRGSFTSPSEKIRKEAVRAVKKSIDVAKDWKCSLVNIWPGQDGYDYAFQVNYQDMWKWFLECVKECAEYDPDMRIAIEYKIHEPRTHCILSTVGKALYVCKEIGLDNVGVTLDVGHALMAFETPAESAVILGMNNKLFQIHVNDNYRNWDWDMIPGAINFWDYLELFAWLRIMKYDEWYMMDVFPGREDPVKVYDQSIRNIQWIMNIVDNIGPEKILKTIQEGDITQTISTLLKLGSSK